MTIEELTICAAYTRLKDMCANINDIVFDFRNIQDILESSYYEEENEKAKEVWKMVELLQEAEAKLTTVKHTIDLMCDHEY